MKSFNGKVVVLTGAGSGIGRALAYALAEEGARLALVDRNGPALEVTAGALAANDVLTGCFSVSDLEEWRSFRADVQQRFGAIDGIVNNAGIAHEAVSVEHLRQSDLMRVMDVNFHGTVHGTQTFLADLIARPEAFVANVSSIFGITAIGLQSAYCASKFAVRGFTDALRMEAAAYHPHLHVATIYPGGIATNITANSIAAGSRTADERAADMDKFEKGLITSPEKAASTILNGLRRKKPRILIGTDAKAGDWITRLRAGGYTKMLLRSLQKQGLVAAEPPRPMEVDDG